MTASDTPVTFTEVFPVQVSAVPKLTAYRLDVGTDISTVGGKLAYRLKRTFPLHWVWANSRILTDAPKDTSEIMKIVQQLWRDQPDVYRGLRNVSLDSNYRGSAQTTAEFVARGLFSDITGKITESLARHKYDLGNALVERVHDVRGWVVQSQPSVSISISSRLVHKQDLKTYVASSKIKPASLVGLVVADKTSSLKDEIVGISGVVSEHRERLLSITQRPEMQEIIEKAADDELVVRVGRNEYDYVVSALKIVVRTEDFGQFGINSQKALRALRMEPGARSRLVKELSDIAKSTNLVGNAYNSRDSSALFLSSNNVGFHPSFRLGRGKVRVYDERALARDLRECGPYKVSDRFCGGVKMRLAALDALSSVGFNEFWSRLCREMDSLGVPVELVRTSKLASVSRAELEMAVEGVQKDRPDILLAFLPDEYGEEEEWDTYHRLKSLTVGRDIATQVVYQSTLGKPYALLNIALGLLGKTGNIPFVLSEPIPYADIVVGIDIARERKKRLAGSISATAITRIYFNDGEFLRYAIHDAPLEGETIPENVIQSLFPAIDFKDKRVVIHRDGYFRGDEKQALKRWASAIGAEFYLVEVIKTGTPRLYAIENGVVRKPIKGSALKLSGTEAFLVSSVPPSNDATPQPLHIRTETPFSIEQAIHSVLSMTLLHYGSLRPPRLPVTIHYSDRIAYLALRGIKPKNAEGSIPFWL